MAKQKTVYFCESCGYESAKWLGNCPSCKSWNTFREEVIVKTATTSKSPAMFSEGKSKPLTLSQIEGSSEKRIRLDDPELERVSGGGIVPGSVILLGGEPGIGKSTLLLSLAMSSCFNKVLYVSGEESALQIKLRAERMGLDSESCLFYTENSTSKIISELKNHQPELLIIDSIQTLESEFIDASPGSVGQIRQCAAEMIRYAKETDTPVFLIGHITKDGNIAGPKVLEHMVDTVLQFEGDRHFAYRILRTVKNRFGSTAELGIYEMRTEGLIPVTNPSKVLIGQHSEDLSGVAIAAMVEGNRPLLIETQSLVSPALYGTPQRSSTGFDHKRLNMLLAVLEKRCGKRLGIHDVYLNMAGGMKVTDPSADLAICMAIVSSLEDSRFSEKVCFAAEVGLGGELRPVSRIESRISEAAKLGFDRIILASSNGLPEKTSFGIKISQYSKLQEVIQSML